jgi:AcrR family transcriptional regulator
MHMSKSGVFAHFGSREELQISVIREYHARFEDEVFFPAMQEPRGLPRLRALFERWVKRVSVEVDSGCIYISGAVEFDDRPGPVRDALVAMVRTWHAALERAIALALAEGQLRPETDPMQMLFELHGLILALHHDARFLRSPGALNRARVGFERTLLHYCTAPGAAAQLAASQRMTQPITQRMTQPITQRMTQPITQRMTQPITQRMTQPITQRITPSRKKAA